jgi:hypothetical protein
MTVDILHHVGLVTRDMDATTGRYERLGFAFTPLSLPRVPLRPGGEPEPLGAGNRTAVFDGNYLEVLAVVDPDRWAAVTPAQRGPYDLDRPLARYEGLHVLHFGTDDIDGVHARLAASGVPNGGVRAFQRTVDTEAGPRVMHARAIGFPPAAHPEALSQVAQHLTPELVFQPRYQKHDNGAVAVVETTVCAADPAERAARYALVSGHPATVDGGVHAVDLGRSRVRVVAPDGLPALLPGAVPPAVPSLVGFTVAVADLAATRALLTDRGVPFASVAGDLLVPATEAAGATVTFTNA